MINSTITLDPGTIQQMVEEAVQEKILSAVESLSQDPVWLEKIERQINQAVVSRTVSKLASTDINSVVNNRVDECMAGLGQKYFKNFASAGIQDRATTCQFTVMDEAVVVENELTTKDLRVVDTAIIKDLVIKGSINTDNRSWDDLKNYISQKTLEKITDDWTKKLIDQVVTQIAEKGIAFEQIRVGDQPLINGNALSKHITESSIQKLGTLNDLQVKGEASVYNTLHVVNRRIGINTNTPEMALSVWDEEVSVVIGKHKAKQAYIGTNRDNGVTIGVNRLPQIEIDTDGLTTIKKLRVGLHRISHDVKVPGWSGTRGDLVFNTNPNSDRVFAWVCLGGHKWQALKSSE